MVTVSDGKSEPQPARIQLSMEVLTLQKEELLFINQSAGPTHTRVSSCI